MKENIFKPLGMNNSGLDDYIEILPNKADGYYVSGERLICCEIDTISAFSAGAIYSTVEDMLLWDKALYNGKLVSQKTMNKIFTPYKNDYGYGWVIDKNLNRKRVHHSGGGNGFRHEYHRYIDDKITVLVLSNYGFANSLNISENIARIVFSENSCMPYRPKAFNLETNIYDNYVGMYQDNENIFFLYPYIYPWKK